MQGWVYVKFSFRLLTVITRTLNSTISLNWSYVVKFSCSSCHSNLQNKMVQIYLIVNKSKLETTEVIKLIASIRILKIYGLPVLDSNHNRNFYPVPVTMLLQEPLVNRPLCAWSLWLIEANLFFFCWLIICFVQVKFHVISHHKLRSSSDDSTISSMLHLNMEQLTKALTSLYHLYEANRGSISTYENEPEFHSLYVLLHLDCNGQAMVGLTFFLIHLSFSQMQPCAG